MPRLWSPTQATKKRPSAARAATLAGVARGVREAHLLRDPGEAPERLERVRRGALEGLRREAGAHPGAGPGPGPAAAPLFPSAERP